MTLGLVISVTFNVAIPMPRRITIPVSLPPPRWRSITVAVAVLARFRSGTVRIVLVGLDSTDT
jgi:hypothetical protein